MGQIAEIAFSRVTDEPVPQGRRTVIASLGRTAQVSLELKAMDSNVLTGYNRMLGDLEIAAGAVRSLRWVPIQEGEPL